MNIKYLFLPKKNSELYVDKKLPEQSENSSFQLDLNYSQLCNQIESENILAG